MSFKYFLIESLHVICRERRLQCYHLIEHTSERPYVTLNVVGLIPPHFRARIVWGSGLRVVEATFIGNFGHIHVTEFGCEIFIEEDIRAF